MMPMTPTMTYDVIGSRGGRYRFEADSARGAAEDVAREYVSYLNKDGNGWTWWARANQPAIGTRPVTAR